MPLQRDEKGVWSLTVGPLPAGFYTYGYAIDGGLRMPDPSNPNLELRRWGPTSLFIVPGGEKAVIEERRVPHGTVHVEFYDSANLNGERMVYVYTPPGYETGKAEVSGSVSAARQRADRSVLDLDRTGQRDHGQSSRRGEGQTDDCGDALRPRAARDQAGATGSAPANDPAAIEKELLTR